MKAGKVCQCLYVIFGAAAVALLITYMSGYKVADWTAATWVGIAICAVACLVCLRCRQREDHGNQ